MNQPTCPSCQHAAHGPGIECEGGVDHGPRRWHRCLCLNLVGADQACPPQMDCQGGTLGYGDVWHLQRGQSLQGANGAVIAPDVLKLDPAAQSPADRAAEHACSNCEGVDPGTCLANPDRPRAADRAALRERIAAAMREHWLCTIREEADADGNLSCRCGNWREPGAAKNSDNDWDSHLADVALALLPEPADRPVVRAETLREAADIAEDVAERLRSECLLDQVNGAHEVMTELRRLAGEQPAQDEARTTWTPGPVAVAQAGEAARTTVAAYLATPCDTCEHTLNWHRNDVGCRVADCACSRFTEEPTA